EREGPGPLKNPYAAGDRPALERGEAVFKTFCQPCHGPAGKGDGLVVQHGFPKPPSLLRDRTKEMSDDQVFRVLNTGRGKMSSYAAQISRDDRWKVILYVRSLQEGSGN